MVSKTTASAVSFAVGVAATVLLLAYRFYSMDAREYENFTTELGRVKHVEIEPPDDMRRR